MRPCLDSDEELRWEYKMFEKDPDFKLPEISEEYKRLHNLTR